MKLPKVSIVICTYKRPDMLRIALESIVNQTVDRTSYEVLVIDNNSNDETCEITEEYMKKNKNVSYQLETKQGLSHSRNCGYINAKADYVGYMDDDAKAPENWVEQTINIIEEFEPDIFGGPIYPFYLNKKPEWFKDEYEIRKKAEKSGWLEKGNISGSNIFFKKELLEEYNGFNPDFGMKEDKISYGEETLIIKRAREEGRKIYYSIDIKMCHFVPEFKQNIVYWMLSNYTAGKVNALSKQSPFKIEDVYNLMELVDNIMVNIEVALKEYSKRGYGSIENFLIEERIIKEFKKIGKIINEYKYSLTPKGNSELSPSKMLDIISNKNKGITLKEFFKSVFMLFKLLITRI